MMYDLVKFRPLGNLYCNEFFSESECMKDTEILPDTCSMVAYLDGQETLLNI